MPEWAQWPFPTADPYPAYRAARDQAPVQWRYDLGAHLVLDHAHAESILRSPQWSSDPRTSPQLLDSLGEFVVEQWSRSLLMSDPPTHTRLRSAVNRFFTPRAVQGLRDRVSAIVDAALEPFADGQRIELMAEAASAIPLAVIAELFDVGVEGAQLLQSEAPTLAGFLELDPTPAQVQAFAGAAMNIMLFLVPIVSERRQRPGDDLISTLIHADDDGVRLEIDEVIIMGLLLLAAGHVTTASLIGNGALALLEHPAQLDRLVERPELACHAVEELLRYDPPAQIASRSSLSDQMLGDVTVRKGDQALIVLGAANRDPARYADPDQLDFERDNLSHLAFGHGPHFCIGAGLARLEAQVTFARLAQPLARARAAGWTSQRDDSITIRRLRTLTLGGAPARVEVHEVEARDRSGGEGR
jgi:cytochrome P450